MYQPKKPCKYCKEYPARHWPFQCNKNPKISSYSIPKQGKSAKSWQMTRREWFIDNKKDYYTCYLCGKSLMPSETTLDHVKSRSSRPDLRYEFSNLKPCCFTCNTLKGSKSVENYLKSKEKH